MPEKEEFDFEPMPIPDMRKDLAGHFRARIYNVVRPAEMKAAQGEAIPYNSESLVKMIYKEAELAGFDPKSLADMRSREDKLLDFRNSLLEDPQNIYGAIEETLQIAENEMDGADRGCGEEISERRAELSTQERVDRGIERRGKDWPGLLARVQRLQVRAKMPVPTGTFQGNATAVEAAHTARYMIYVGRSSTMKLHEGSDSDQFSLSWHHYKILTDIWEARNGVAYPTSGPRRGQAVKRGRSPFKIALIICPPGHGKSDLVMHLLALEFCLRPPTLAMYLHAVEDEAVKNKGHVARLFSRENSAGLRNLALFPNLRLSKKDNNEKTMRLDLKEKSKSPSLRAAGCMSARLGADLNLLVLDDIVPQDDVDEPTTRERRFERLSGTFSTRMRGKDTFIICIGTIWHKDDCLSKFRAMADRMSDVCLSSVQTCGGPSTSPAFDPLWPEAYPASELRKRFDMMNRNHTLWSAAYEANPLAHADRIVRKLRYYDPNSQEHVDFMSSAQMHVSIDPTATNREGSDHAGIMLVGLGEVSAVENGVRTWQTRMRICDAQRIHANQVELADHIAAYVLQRPVYQVHIETRSGFHATADIFENKYGLEVQRHDPTNKNKGVRFKEVAGLIDDSAPGFRAIVEFPGLQLPDGSFGPDPRWKFLYEQILDFGVASDDEFVDTLAQISKHFNRNGELVGGTSEASEAVRRVVQLKGDPRDREWFRNLMDNAREGGTDIEQDECRYIAERYGAPSSTPSFLGDGEFWKYK